MDSPKTTFEEGLKFTDSESCLPGYTTNPYYNKFDLSKISEHMQDQINQLKSIYPDFKIDQGLASLASVQKALYKEKEDTENKDPVVMHVHMIASISRKSFVSLFNQLLEYKLEQNQNPAQKIEVVQYFFIDGNDEKQFKDLLKR